MSDYTKLTAYDIKDALSTGDPLKRVKGTELDDEFDAIAVAIATKANSASPTFTGTPTAPTATAGTNTTQIATTAFVNSASTSGNAATATAPASGGTFVTSANISSQSVSYASTAGSASNGGVTSVNGGTGAVDLAALSVFAKSLSTNGYQKLPGGLIMQWGTQGNIGIGYGTVSFPISFPSVCLGVVGSLNRGTAGDARWPYSWNTSNFQCPSDNCETFWVAFGY